MGTVNFSEVLANARAAGSPDARAELLESFREYLRRIANERLRKDLQGQLSISDIVQSAIIDAEKGFSNCRAENQAEFKAWLRQILLNDIVNKYRHLQRQKRDVRRERPLEKNTPHVSETSPSERLVHEEDQRRLANAIQQLPPEYQQVIELRHRENLTFVEIGKQMDKTPDATRMLWNRAIEQLSKVLKTEG